MAMRSALCGLFLIFAGAMPAFPQEVSLADRGEGWSASLRKYWGTTFKIGGKNLPRMRADDIPGTPLPDTPRLCHWQGEDLALDKNPGSNPELLIQCLVMGESWTENQLAILAKIEALGISFGHLWLGSHVVIKGDGGAVYADWTRRGAVRRISSHYLGVKVPQFEISFKRYALLFGKNREGETWFQMENHAARTVLGKPGHLLDFINLEISKRNIGPLGSSNRTERFPLFVAYNASSR